MFDKLTALKMFAAISDDLFILPHRLSRVTSPRGVAAPVRPRATVARRNALCPCGSGKKFKKCCIGG